MQPGDFYAAQIHYHYEPKWDDLPPDESTVIADFADAEEIAAAGGSLDPITLSLFQTPAEIPCAPDKSGPLCDRDASPAEMVERTGGAGLASSIMNRRCGLDPADITPQPDGKSSTTCDLPAQTGEIVWVWAHMHEETAELEVQLFFGHEP